MMSSEKRQKSFFIFLNITVAIWATVMFILLPACSNKEKNVAEAITDRDSLPSMKTLGVTTLISDSGITRYKIITEEWEVYDKKDPPYWAFEKGVYLEKFDSLFRIDASIKADTAYYYEKKKLWELRSNVHIRSQRGDKFDTDLMFWDEEKETVYSDHFIRIEQEDKIITGYGFESNQELTEYQIYNNTGIFTVEDTAPAHPAQADSTTVNTASADTTAVNAAQADSTKVKTTKKKTTTKKTTTKKTTKTKTGPANTAQTDSKH